MAGTSRHALHPPSGAWPRLVVFRRELMSSEFGHGLAQGISVAVRLLNGRIHASIRKVLTFPGPGTPVE